MIPTAMKYYAFAKGCEEPAVKPPTVVKGEKAVVTERKVEKFLKTWEEATFGDLMIIQSQSRSNRVWTELPDVAEKKDGDQVWIRARVESIRAKGKAGFIVLRFGYSTLQASMFAGTEPGTVDKEMIKFASKIPNESVVDVFGTLKAATVGSTTIKNLELQLQRLYVISASSPVLPFQIADASRPELEEGKADDGLIRVKQDIRLNNRWIDLRTMANHGIFLLQSRVGQYFRDFLIQNKFVEIHSPKLTPGVSEGGSAVFRLSYFGDKACLAQSPQLSKQMSVLSDLMRVFEVGPVFRAENSLTHRHLCEFTGLDFEMAIKEHYHEVLEMLGGLFISIFDNINANCKEELAAINKQYPFQPLVYGKKTLIIPFKEAIQMLRDNGVTTGDLDDFSTPNEKLIGKLVKAKYGVDFYIIDQFPASCRPFYTMPNPADPLYSNSFDVFIRGEEVTSGSQRVHDVTLLLKRAAECGIPENNIAKYAESFRFGAWPHGGAGIGLERVVMLFCGLADIRMCSLFPRDPKRIAP